MVVDVAALVAEAVEVDSPSRVGAVAWTHTAAGE